MKRAKHTCKEYTGGGPAATQRPFRSWLSALGLIAMTAFAQGAWAVTYANKSNPFSWVNTSTHAHVGSGTIPYKFNGTIAPGTACGSTLPILDDTISDAIPFGFNFNYGGIVFTSARISSNGRLQFNNNTACGYGSPVTQLPYVYYTSATDNLNYSMRIYGNDLDPTPQVNAPYSTACASTVTCYISYASIGSAPNRQFVVTWNSIPEWAAGGSTSGNYNLQLILNEDGTFIYQYGSDTPGPQATLAQVGWQVSQTDYDVPSVGLPANNSAILFYIPIPVAQYHFQQSAWTAAGQVLDTSGSTPVYNGTALGGATPGVGYVCNGAVIPNNISTATIGAIDTGIPVPTALGGIGTIDFWYKANAAWVGGGDAQLLDATTANNQWFFAVKRSTGTVKFVITDSTGTVLSAETPVNNIAAGTWTHIALTWNFNALAGSNNDHMSVYINGVQTVLSKFTTSGTVSPSVGTLYLGDNRSSFTGQNGTGNSANGTLDEVNIYTFEGGTGLIQRDMNYTASCADHIEIDHTGSALTCSPQTVTIKACANVACTTLYTVGGVNVTLTPGGLTFPIGVSGTNNAAAVQQSTAGVVTLAAASAPAAINATTCLNTVTGTASCAMTFSNSGFLVTVPNHTSCTNPTATIEAVQQGVPANRCVPAYQSVTRAVNLYTSYTNPITGTLGVTASTGAVSTAAPGTAHNLAFDATGKSTITLSYPDAGQITLTVTDTAPTGAAMIGSGMFVVAPASFVFSAIPAAPLTAGQPFNATVTAMRPACTMPPAPAAATPNFNGTVTLTSSNPQPGIGNATAINAALSGFSNGVASTNLTWNEVGTIDLNASLNAYLGWTPTLPATWLVNSTQAGVGRFHPAYFDTTALPACGTFSYAGSTAPIKVGQPFIVTVTAKAAGSSITANYAGANAYLTTLSNAGVTTGFANNTIAAASFINGVGSANVTYAVATPQTAPLTLTLLRATDADVPAVSSSGHVEASMAIRSGRARFNNAHGSEILALPVPFRTEYWNNGWVINAADSCTGDATLGVANAVSVTLAPPAAWAAGIACVQDSGNPGLSGAGCAAAGPAVQKYKEGATPTIGFAGNFNLWLKAPGVGNTGAVTVTGNVPTWLQYPWGGGAAINPTARATFGVYKGANEFIYLRENY